MSKLKREIASVLEIAERVEAYNKAFDPVLIAHYAQGLNQTSEVKYQDIDHFVLAGKGVMSYNFTVWQNEEEARSHKPFSDYTEQVFRKLNYFLTSVVRKHPMLAGKFPVGEVTFIKSFIDPVLLDLDLNENETFNVECVFSDDIKGPEVVSRILIGAHLAGKSLIVPVNELTSSPVLHQAWTKMLSHARSVFFLDTKSNKMVSTMPEQGLVVLKGKV